MLTPAEIHEVKRFIEFFAAIPDEQWCCPQYVQWGCGMPLARCALGHLGVVAGIPHGSPAHHFNDLFQDCVGESVARVNDGLSDAFQQPTPKARVLAALRSVIA